MENHRFDTSYDASSADAEWNSSYRMSPSMPSVAESPTATSSSSDSPGRSYSQPNSPLVIRSNFGKGGGFVPPNTAGGIKGGYYEGHETSDRRTGGRATRQAQHVSSQRATNNYSVNMARMTINGSEPFDDESKEMFNPVKIASRTISDTSRPFDEKKQESTMAVLDGSPSRLNVSTGSSNHAISALPNETQNLTDWEHSPPRGAVNSSHRSYYSDASNEDQSFKLFRMPPLRVSEPLSKPYNQDSSSGREDTDDSRDLSEAAHLQGQSPSRAGAGRTPNGDYGDFGLADGSVAAESSAISNPRFPGEEVDEVSENDSLFEFEEGMRRKAKEAGKVTKKWRSRRRSKHEDDEDDTSLEQDYGAVSPNSRLQERTQAAWKRKSAAKRSTTPDFSESKDTQSVSFGKDHTVHTFEPDLEATVETKSISQRSLNSEYTKSAESEVEDVIKDILLIGPGESTKPGRRKIKYCSSNQPRLRDSAHEIDEEDTFDPSIVADDSPRKAASRRERGRSTTRRLKSMQVIDEKKEEDDPLLGVWNYMEGGFNAVSTALGLESRSGDSGEISRVSERERNMNRPKGKTGGFQNIFEYYTDVLLGSASTESACETTAAGPEPEGGLEEIEDEEEEEEELYAPPSLEEDLRLVDLALQAARSAHRLKGYEFDETYDVDIVNDVNFSVVDLALPLGLIFQENDGGCWVTKVLPEGTAKQSGSVKIGDQLAAIDGVSAIRMTIDEIARTIKKKNAVIELTFLRYVGPLKPAAGDIEEEGYEVKASSRAARVDPPGTRRQGKEGSKRPIALKTDTKTKANTHKAQRSPKVDQQAEAGKRRFRWFGRKKE